jgi:hypothetical protein
MLPTTALHSVPTPAQIAIESSRAEFLRIDRGHVRQSNDSSADSRLCHFATWLVIQGYDKQSAWSITPNLAIDLIGTYLQWVRQGNSLPSTSKGPIGKQTLHNYVTSAAQYVSY